MIISIIRHCDLMKYRTENKKWKYNDVPNQLDRTALIIVFIFKTKNNVVRLFYEKGGIYFLQVCWYIMIWYKRSVLEKTIISWYDRSFSPVVNYNCKQLGKLCCTSVVPRFLSLLWRSYQLKAFVAHWCIKTIKLQCSNTYI